MLLHYFQGLLDQVSNIVPLTLRIVNFVTRVLVSVLEQVEYR